MVMVTLVPKYDDVEEVRKHNEYTPATALLSLTYSVTLVGEEYAEDTLVTTLVGVPLHTVDDITNADQSEATSTRPAPVTPIVDTAVLAAITLGDKDVTLITLRPPASTYSDDCVHREHSRYTPAGVLPFTAHVNVITEPYPLLDVIHVPAITAGFVAFGVEHDDAITNAIPSPDTLGIHDPLTVTI